jgi:hypothetical protein
MTSAARSCSVSSPLIVVIAAVSRPFGSTQPTFCWLAPHLHHDMKAAAQELPGSLSHDTTPASSRSLPLGPSLGERGEPGRRHCALFGGADAQED